MLLLLLILLFLFILLLWIPETDLLILVKIRSVTAEILMMLSWGCDKKDPPDNIFYSVHIALLNIFPKPGFMWVSGLVKVWCCMEVIATFAIYVVFKAVRILLCLLNTIIKRVDMVWIDFPQLLTFINKWFTGVYSLFKQNRCPCYKTKQLTEFITRLSCFNLMICME